MPTDVQQYYQVFDDAGEMIPDEADISSLLPLKPRQTAPPFTLCHLPSRWLWNKDHGWYPDLTSIQHRPGANGVTRHGMSSNSPINPQPAISGHMTKGALIIERKDPRIPGGDYIRRHKTRYGQHHHCLRFESWSRVGRGKMRRRFDLPRYVEWLRELEAVGMIMPMAEDVLLDSLDILDKRIDRYQNDPRIGSAAIKLGLKRAQDERDRMISDWEERYGDPEPKPKKGKK